MTESKLLPPTTAENWEAQNITGRDFAWEYIIATDRDIKSNME